MKTKIQTLLTALALLIDIHHVSAQGTAFTYQGELNNNGLPANGDYDLTFALFNNASTNSGQVGGTLTNLNVGVTNGLFAVTLDFGASFAGTSEWLAIGVRTNGATSFTALNPLQEVTPTPYAIYASNAGSATSASSVPAEDIVGTIPAGQLPSSVLTNGASAVNLSGTFSGDGSQLTNVIATTLATSSLYSSNGVVITLSTNSYASSGTYTFSVPTGANTLVAKLWGAGGGSGFYPGGSGAFSQVILNVTPGQTYLVVVGQSGLAGGGSGSNDGSGGAATADSGYINNGGQASSLFNFTDSEYIMKAIAGGGGGGSTGGAVEDGIGGSGLATGSGSGYSSRATTIGETNLNLMGGDGSAGGSSGGVYGGGGGGGYGGGSGSLQRGGAGGGSYGDITLSGGSDFEDPNYQSPAGYPDNAGLAVIIFLDRVPVANLTETVQAVSFVGDGSLLTALTATNLIGTLPSSALPASVVTNTETGVSLSGNFSGSAAGLTGLNASAIAGTIADTQLSPNVALRTNGNTFTGTQTLNGNINIDTTLNLEGDLMVNTNIYLNAHAIYFRGGDEGVIDHNHGLAYEGSGYTNFGGTTYQYVDGPALWGNAGGVLGTRAGGDHGSLVWSPTSVTVNGTFNNNSDRSAKQDFTPVTPAQILDKVAQLPLSQWSYKTDASTRHIGPMAQDFYSAFNVGTDDRHIAPIDEGGVALAAIKGLNQKLESETKAKDAEIQDLKQSVAGLQKLVQSLLEKK